jgi:hypothetical protein
VKAATLKVVFAGLLVALHCAANADTLLEMAQRALIEQGYTPGNLIGEWDIATENEIARFQLDNGLQPPDGNLTVDTLNALDVEILRSFTGSSIYFQSGLEHNPEIYGSVAQPILPTKVQRPKWERPEIERGPIGSLTWNGHVGIAISNADASSELATESSVSGGGGLLVGGGLGLHFANSPWGVQLGLGYKLDHDSRGGTSTSLQRLPLSLIAYRGTERYRLGLGLVTHLSTSFRQTNSADQSADSGIGWTAAFEYRYRRLKYLSWGMRYENIDYDFSGASVDRVNGNNVAVYLGWSQF